jgi:hypothetical protein
MKRAEFNFEDTSCGCFETGSEPVDVAGRPEGDGDFESDNLPSTGETSAGGHVVPNDDRAADSPKGRGEHEGLKHVIDEVITGKIQP